MKTMHTYTSRLLAIFMSLAIVVGLLPSLSLRAEAASPAVDISVSGNSSVFIYDTIDLSAVVTPQVIGETFNPANYEIEWTWSAQPGGGALSPSNVRGTLNATFTGVNAGAVDVTVTLRDKSSSASYSATTVVTVLERVFVTGIVLNPSSGEIRVGGTLKMEARIAPTNATDQELAWSTSNEDVVSIRPDPGDPSGHTYILTALKEGTVTIEATAMDAGLVAKSATITVIPSYTYPTGIVLDSSASIIVGKTLALKATVMPTGANVKTVTWTIPRAFDEYASVNYNTGVVTAKKVTPPGVTVPVTATANDLDKNGNPVKETCNVTITVSAVPVTGITMNLTETTVVVGKTAPLVATLSPVNGSNKLIYWTSSDITRASVKASGNSGATMNVTGVAVTDANRPVIISAYSAEDNTLVAQCKVTVIPVPVDPIKTITLNNTVSVLAIGSTVTPKATITPSNATIKTLNWGSSNPDVASVEASGKITAKSGGVATVTATAADGGGSSGTPATASCKVHVVTLNADERTLRTGGSFLLKVNDLPTSGVTVAWSTSKASVANTNAKSGTEVTVTAGAAGTATITAQIKSGTVVLATLKCQITVTSAADTIYYYIDGKTPVQFAINDFASVCTKTTGNNLSYVRFALPDSYEGTLYTSYDKTGEAKVTTTGYYYRSGTPRLADVSFVPASTFIGPTTFSYTATDDKNNTYTGDITISVSDATGDIKYATTKDKPVTFRGVDFNSFSREKTGVNLNSIKFTNLPTSKEGTLYYMYEPDEKGKPTGQKVATTTTYYYSNAPHISDLTFVPAEGFVGTLDLKFTGRDTQTNLVSGTVRITVGRSTNADIEYVIKKNNTLSFSLTDFNDFSLLKTDNKLNYVQFTLPSDQKGRLYYNYVSQDKYGSRVTADKRYYRSSSPYLSDVTFVPAENYEGTVTLKFTGISEGGEVLSGTVAIVVGDGVGDVRYSAGVNVPITFQGEDFNSFCYSETGSNMSYVEFGTPKSTEGTMYHQYARSGETSVTASTAYYRANQPRLDEITFVPAADFKGIIEFPFKARSMSNESVSGTLVISYSDSITGGTPIIRYSTQYRPVSLQSGDFVEACEATNSNTLRSIQFILPPKTVGHLYYDYTSHDAYGGRVDEKTSYTAGGANDISRVSFMPRAGNTGSINIPYEGIDEKGLSYTGYVEINVSPTTVSHFIDMNGDMWAISSVEFLSEENVVQGTGTNTYSPRQYISRGDFMLMIYRAFNLEAGTVSDFRDVPRSTYYYQAISAARAAGIAQGDTNGYFNPRAALTREDAMVLINRTLTYVGRGVDVAPSSFLNRFNDGGYVSGYAKNDVAALIQAGLILGDENMSLKPLAPLTRAEMAVILHRVLTM